MVVWRDEEGDVMEVNDDETLIDALDDMRKLDHLAKFYVNIIGDEEEVVEEKDKEMEVQDQQQEVKDRNFIGEEYPVLEEAFKKCEVIKLSRTHKNNYIYTVYIHTMKLSNLI